jgi:hypothetical protein
MREEAAGRDLPVVQGAGQPIGALKAGRVAGRVVVYSVMAHVSSVCVLSLRG